ncbi:Choline dehydrogenase [Rhodococcus ruber]|uniref:Choline dehydrogenase n=1 Tax=Rhodococcus ruber TaxID=1830 RepID=A0A098BNN2_9NOCA|nr:Choline dehydrogenase [Rhodococcus ruber]
MNRPCHHPRPGTADGAPPESEDSGGAPSDAGLLELGEHRALGDGGARLDRQARDDTGLVRVDRVLHLHGLEHHDQVALGDLLALGDRDLDDGALHRRGDRVTGGLAAVGAAALARLRLLAQRPAGRSATGAEGELTGQRHLDATAADLDDDVLPRQGLVLVLGRGRTAGVRLDGVLPLGFDPLGVDVELLAVPDERGVLDDVPVERDHGGQAVDLELGQGAAGALERLLPGLARDDQLGEHRVELPADDVALHHAGVDAHTRARGLAVHADRAGGRQEAAAGVLAVDAELERVPARGRVLGDLELLAVGDAELLAHQVDARGLLGDRVLDLQAGVDLEEGDGVALDQVLDRAGAVVAGLAADGLGGLVDAAALLVGQERRGGLLDELLEAALQRAVAGAGDDDVAVLVGDDLRLDVAGLVEVLLDEALAAAEGGDGLAGRGLEQLGDLLDGVRDLHAAAATAEGRLDRDRHAVLLRELHDLVGIGDGVLGARGHRGLGALGDVPCGDLVTEVADGLRGGADPDQAGVDHGLGEVGVLGQEAVAGVDRVGAGLAGGVEDLVEHQVGLGGGLATERECLVGELHELGVGVGFCVDGHAPVTGVLGGSDDPHSDLAAVGDEHLRDVRAGMTGHGASC